MEVNLGNADGDAKLPIHRMEMVPVHRDANEFLSKGEYKLFSPILL